MTPIALLPNGKRLPGYENGRDGFYYKVETWVTGGKRTVKRGADGRKIMRSKGDKRPKWMKRRDLLAKVDATIARMRLQSPQTTSP